MMPSIVTPKSLNRRSEFYHRLASLTSAGMGLIQALDSLGRAPPAGSFRAPLVRLTQLLESGHTLEEALSGLGGWVPPYDRALLGAAEQSGRLDTAFRSLAEHYRQQAQLARRTLTNLAYPCFLLHVAVLLLPISVLVGLVWRGDVAGFLLQKLSVLGPAYGMLLLAVWASRSQLSDGWRTRKEQLLERIPILGRAHREVALARLAGALEGLLNAGVGIVVAWELAARASDSPRLERAVGNWRTRMEAGQTPAELLRGSRHFPSTFAQLYQTGEESGQLDQTLGRLRDHYQEEGARRMQAFAEWFPRLVYLAVMLGIAFQVISFYLGYFNQISKAGGF